jgi:precorrin-2/cobalt-factor-2 C20-methyltransferase
MTGRLYGIGVGPGDPELITVKGLRLLRETPVLAYPAPEKGDSLARSIVAGHLNGAKTEVPIRMPIVAARFPAQAVYDETVETLSEHLGAGRNVAVLCEGDPFFYGSFMYLFGRMAERFPVEVIPGVSSLTACAAVLGAPLAARNDVMTVIPAPLESDLIKARLKENDAAAIIKVGRHFARVRGLLAELGLAAQAHYVERATMENERILPLQEVDDSAVPYFSMIIVHKRGEAWRL